MGGESAARAGNFDLIGCFNEAFDQIARIDVAGNNDMLRRLFNIEAQLRLARLLVRAMTTEAILGKDRPHVAHEADGLVVGLGRGRNCQNE